MQYIKAQWQALKGWSQRMHVAPPNSTTKYKYGVDVVDGFGYTPATEEALAEIDIEYEIVDTNPAHNVENGL